MGGRGRRGRQQRAAGPPDFKKSSVRVLSPDSWRSETKSPKLIILVAFYKPNDPVFAEAAEGYKELGKSLEGYVKVAAVDCGQHQAFCEERGVGRKLLRQGPVIKLYGYRAHDRPRSFNGRISPKALHKFVRKNMPSFATVIRDSIDAKNFIGKKASTGTKIFLISKKTKVSLLYSSLSKDFHQHVGFALIPSSAHSALRSLKKLGVDMEDAILDENALPVIYIHHPSIGEKPRRYRGKLTYQELRKYVNTLIKRLKKIKNEL